MIDRPKQIDPSRKDVCGSLKDLFAPMKDVFKRFKDVFARMKDVFKSLEDIFAPGKDVFNSSKDVFARRKDVFQSFKDVNAAMKDVFKSSPCTVDVIARLRPPSLATQMPRYRITGINFPLLSASTARRRPSISSKLRMPERYKLRMKSSATCPCFRAFASWHAATILR